MPRTVRYAILSFLLLNTANFLLRPIRDGIGIQLGDATLPYLFLCTLVVMVVLALQFGRSSARSVLRHWLARFYGCFCLWLSVYLIFILNGGVSSILNACFFVSISVFNLFSISLLWSNLVSQFKTEDAGQLFGKIATGLAGGAILGSIVGSLLVRPIGQEGLIILAIPAILLSLLIQCNLLLQAPGTVSESTPDPEKLQWKALPALFKVIRHSALLKASSIQIFLYAIVNTFFYFEQLELVQSSSFHPLEQVRILANIALIIHVASFLLQWFGFQRLIQRYSKQQLLVTIPVVVSILLIAQLWHPAFWLLILGMTSHKIGSYALIRPLREVLHTQLRPQAKFGAKNLVDTVFSRSGDVAGSWTYEIFFGSLSHPLLIGLATLPLSIAWLWNSWYLAKITESTTT